jgi:hypothetical protein
MASVGLHPQSQSCVRQTVRKSATPLCNGKGGGGGVRAVFQLSKIPAGLLSRQWHQTHKGNRLCKGDKGDMRMSHTTLQYHVSCVPLGLTKKARHAIASPIHIIAS